MLFLTENSKYLKTYLVDIVASVSDSDTDPQILADFMFALLQSDASQEVLYDRCIKELQVFLEEKTDDIVKRVFSALDDNSYLPKDTQPTSTTTSSSAATEISKRSTVTPTPTSRSYGNDDDDEDEDDDDNETNFKRRSHKSTPAPTESTDSTDQPHKRSFPNDDGSETGRMIKLSRQESSSGQHKLFSQKYGGYRSIKKRCFDYDNKGYCMRGDSCRYEHGDERVIMETNDQGVMKRVKDENGDGKTYGQGGGGGRTIANRSGSTRQEDIPYTSRYTPYSTKIVVENIPQDYCNSDSVTDFFGKFGKLVNLSVQVDASRAFLQYATHQEALAAYQSPAVIFKNRFVKVFWKKVNAEEERKEYMEQQRLASQPDPEAVKAKAAQLAKEKEERQKKQQEHLKKLLEVQKHKQQLMEKQIEEHKKLIERLGETPPGSKERESILSAINHLSSLINTKNSPTTTPPPAPSNTVINQPSASPSSQQSTEKSSSPVTTTTTTSVDAKKAEMEKLKAKLASLEAAKAAGYSSHRGGRGGMNTWSSRGAKSYSIDNRQKTTPPSQPTTTTSSGTNVNQENDTKTQSSVSKTEIKEGSEAGGAQGNIE